MTGKCAAYCRQDNRRPVRLELLTDGTPANRIPNNADTVSYTRGTETACDYWDRNCEDIYADACATEHEDEDVADDGECDGSGLSGDAVDPDQSWDVA